MQKRIIIPIPSYGFDPTEISIPFIALKKSGHSVTIATPDGKTAAGDAIMLNGNGLGIWKGLLRTRKDAVQAYQNMINEPEFKKPIKYEAINPEEFDAILLGGGHDKGVKEYLESEKIHNSINSFFVLNKPVAAICHGVIAAARSINPDNGKSVLYAYNTTCLLESQELTAYKLTKSKLSDYYLTYPGLTVEAEVKSVLATPSQFKTGPFPLLRDSAENLNRGFICRDKNYLSARWPGDVYCFTNEFLKMVKNGDS